MRLSQCERIGAGDPSLYRPAQSETQAVPVDSQSHRHSGKSEARLGCPQGSRVCSEESEVRRSTEYRPPAERRTRLTAAKTGHPRFIKLHRSQPTWSPHDPAP